MVLVLHEPLRDGVIGRLRAIIPFSGARRGTVLPISEAAYMPNPKKTRERERKDGSMFFAGLCETRT
jgi:hypothetical protein